MGTNSIKDNLNKEDIISDLKLELGADIHKQKVFVFVEGNDDIRFLKSFLSDQVVLYESYNGKLGVECFVADLYKSNYRVIGIRDKDYQLSSCSPKIFFYDYNCMEMMLISNDNVFKSLFEEYYRGAYNWCELRSLIMEELKYLSCFRKLNELNIWEVNLRGLSISKAFNKKVFQVKNELIKAQIEERNAGIISPEMLSSVQSEFEEEWNCEDFYHWTNGHDFIKLFAEICANGYKDSVIASSARCAFRETDMVATQLYSEIRQYEVAKKVKVFNNMLS